MVVRTKRIKSEPGRADIVYPNFLYIGAEKAGSSWIYEILREHPQVYVPPAKDIQFFDKNFDKGIEWYLSLFGSGAGQIAIGEVSHDYFLAQETDDYFTIRKRRVIIGYFANSIASLM